MAPIAGVQGPPLKLALPAGRNQFGRISNFLTKSLNWSPRNYPPTNIRVSDYHIGQALSHATGLERRTRWPAGFDKSGFIRASRANYVAAAKTEESDIDRRGVYT